MKNSRAENLRQDSAAADRRRVMKMRVNIQDFMSGRQLSRTSVEHQLGHLYRR